MDIESCENEPLSADFLSYVDEFYKHSMDALKGNLTRLELTKYTNLSERYLLNDIKNMNFDVQYSHLYFARLLELRPALINKLKALKLTPLKVIDVKKDTRVAVTGTIYKEMKFKPNVLQRMNAEAAMGPNKFKSYVAEDDYLYLEDDSARAKLEFHENSVFKCNELSVNDKRASPGNLITGMVVGVVGFTNDKGTIIVDEIIFDDTLIQEKKEPYLNFVKEAKILGHEDYNMITNLNPVEKYLTSISKDDKYIALVSGLNIHHDSSNFSINMLKSFLFGGLTSSPMAKLASRIMKVVFAGDMIAEQHEMMIALQGAFKMQDMFSKLQVETGKALKQLDDLMKDLAQKIPVDVMPGEQDPSDDRLPQQPLNRSYFPTSYSYGGLTAVSNPYEFEIDDVRILGTSGQNIKDIMQYSNISSEAIEVMKCNLLWRHIAPTAPDTLKCHCFTSDDPFVLQNLPHIYFAGCQAKFSTKLMVNEKEQTICRLITVPVFSKSQSVVLVNLRNLDTFEVHFGAVEESQ